MPLLIDVFPARSDNYGYLVHDVATGRTAAIDAPEAKPIREALGRRGWTLTDILITHHHSDHVEAIPPLKREYGAIVTGPRAEAAKILGLDRLVADGDTIAIGQSEFVVIEAPGHTLGQVVYYDPEGRHLFSADALFSLGVGRMFEGSPKPMWDGLVRLRELPNDTLVYCGHEYAQSNAAFALTVDPNNAALRIRAGEVDRLRAQNLPTVPVSLGLEKAANPFLRADHPTLARAMKLPADADAHVVFAALRRAKDEFKPA